jgi:hypothetical protein
MDTNCTRRLDNFLPNLLPSEFSTTPCEFKQFSLTIGIIEELQRSRNNNANVEGPDE